MLISYASILDFVCTFTLIQSTPMYNENSIIIFNKTEFNIFESSL
jgi:hypothetical protein